MPIHRAEHKENFTQILNNLLSDERLSYGARGVMAYALTHYDDWTFTGEDYFITELDKKTKIRSFIKELVNYGYLNRIAIRNDKGIFQGYRYEFYEKPFLDYPILEKPILDEPKSDNINMDKAIENTTIEPFSDLPNSDYPFLGEPFSENRKLNNTNITNNYIYTSIFNYWNSKAIKKHRVLTKEIEKAINKVLKIKVEGEFIKENDIKKAIDNYKEVLESEYFFNHKWTLTEFLTRKQKDTGINQLVLFLDNGTTYENYIEWCNKEKPIKSNSVEDRYVL